MCVNINCEWKCAVLIHEISTCNGAKLGEGTVCTNSENCGDFYVLVIRLQTRCASLESLAMFREDDGIMNG